MLPGSKCDSMDIQIPDSSDIQHRMVRETIYVLRYKYANVDLRSKLDNLSYKISSSEDRSRFPDLSVKPSLERGGAISFQNRIFSILYVYRFVETLGRLCIQD